jgi:predicted phosphatase
MIKLKNNESSTTGGNSSFKSGAGEQYMVPLNKKKYKYKLSEKFLKEIEQNPAKDFQQKRIAAFDEIEKELNNIYKTLSNSKNNTIQFYNDNPSSFSVITPTDMILDYIRDIKELLEQ